MKKCIVCGEETDKPIEDALWHFRFYDPGMWQYMKGNMKCFGYWQGFLSTLGLAFPWFNTLRFWRYRKCRLVIEGVTDKDGKLLNKDATCIVNK
jgi:hypothetical protein